MSIHDNLGNRMKQYEAVPSIKLIRRTPVAIRIDGKAFHTFTRKFQKPFDSVLISTMQDTMKYLCENIQGCVLGYTQSDEITLILTDYSTFETSAWFDYKIQKVCSISSSMATFAFNKNFERNIKCNNQNEQLKVYEAAAAKGALFDSRCFNISKEEVTNLVYWRQLDAIRNSILSVGQYYFSASQLHKKTCKDILSMLQEKGIIWDELPIGQQRGYCCIKNSDNKWIIDLNIPIFINEGREYIESRI